MSKPQSSEITTQHAAQPSRTGTQLGALGSAMPGSLADLPKVATPEAAAHIKQCLTPFRALRPKDRAEVEATQSAIAYLSKPAPGDWIAARIVTLLSHYFTAQQDERQAKAVARDWADLLDGQPAWAIANACRWWIGMENPRRSFKPVPGDIQAQCHKELEAVRAARTMITLGPCTKKPEIAVQTPLRAREMASEAEAVLKSAVEGVKNAIR